MDIYTNQNTISNLDKHALQVLQKCPLFLGINTSAIQAVLLELKASKQPFSRGEYLIHAGDILGRFGIVLEGTIVVTQTDFWGNHNLVARLKPGQIFAESFAFAGELPTTVSVYADMDTLILWINSERLRSLDYERSQTSKQAYPSTVHFQLLQNLISVLANKNLHLNEKLSHMGKRTTREKLMSYLSTQAQKAGSAQFTIELTRQQLADYLTVNRSALSTELSRLQKEGHITYKGNRFSLQKNLTLS